MSYQHLSLGEREELARLNLLGVSQSAIAKELGRERSTIWRELLRNGRRDEYLAYGAEVEARRRRKKSKVPWKLRYDPLMRYVKKKLSLAWSPEQIAGRLRVDIPRDGRMRISHETIYGWVWADKREGGELWRHLRQSRRKRRKRRSGRELRGSIPGRVGIEKRPAIVEKRTRFGDWESDTVVGSRQRGALATHVERKSGFMVGAKLPDKKALTYTRRTVRAFRSEPQLPMKTMTADNGKEFADFKNLATELGVSFYFARPYHSWERGSNENANGLLRQFFPKTMDLRKLSKRDLDKVFRLVNNRPRKRHGYRSPVEVLRRRRAVALQI